jgi:glycolate oxidase iron-sulfur subunit
MGVTPRRLRPGRYVDGVLDLDEKELATCVSCGLCLPYCPTFRVTGEEGLSPRGRIDAMRAVQWRGAPIDDAIVHFVDTCVQCRGCEPVCPSSVPFGHLIEGTKAALADRRAITPRWQRWAYKVLPRHRLLLAGSTLLAIGQRLRLVPNRLRMEGIPIRRRRLRVATRGTGASVWLFTGCVMDAWMRSTHQSTVSVLEAAGAAVRLSPPTASCCGALHTHAGLHRDAQRLAERVIGSMPGDDAVLVNSAGCGAAMKDYGRLLGTNAAATFAARVHDVHEWLSDHRDRLPAPRRRLPGVIVQDPCHLRHVQRAHETVRSVLGVYVDLVELDDEGLCCGAGGAYSALHPALAADIRVRKLGSIERASDRTGATIVASANPGCVMHLRAAGVDARHPVDLIQEAVS